MASPQQSRGRGNGRGRGRGRGRGGHFPPKPGSAKALRVETAEQTAALLPDLLAKLRSPIPDPSLYRAPGPLDASKSPNHPSATVYILNQDALDAALDLMDASQSPPTYPLVLNLASEKNPGGGWMHGSLAQEEAICYRSSLSTTLTRNFYPIPPDAGIYSPRVLIIRQSIADGHAILDLSKPDELKAVSIATVPALRRPAVAKKTNASGSPVEVYADPADEERMKLKMRCTLRIAGKENKTRLVLGALGCGAFGNPKAEVARLWKEVLEETEWKGWFERIVFAVLDTGEEGNYSIFKDTLDGLSV